MRTDNRFVVDTVVKPVKQARESLNPMSDHECPNLIMSAQPLRKRLRND